MAGVSSDWRHRRMTGSAFARYELRGTFHVVVLRALSGIEGEFEGERVAGLSPDRASGRIFFGAARLTFSRFFAPRRPAKTEPKMELCWSSSWDRFWIVF